MPGERPPSDSALSIEDLFAEAVAAVESIGTEEEVEIEIEADEPAEAEIELEIETPEEEPPEEEPELTISPEESRVLQKRAARRAKLKARLTDLERTRDAAREEARTLRTEMLRMKATNQRLRERLDRLQSHSEGLEEARQAAEAQATRFRDRQNRLSADLRHFQERRRQEVTAHKRHGQAPSIIAMLPVLDHLQMAIDHADAEPEKILGGVRMVISQFEGVLRRLGVSRVECETGGAFHPELHEAMMRTPTDDVPVGHIVQQIAAGYSLNGRLLRAARVSVAEPLPDPVESPDVVEPEETPQPPGSQPAQVEDLFETPEVFHEE